MQVGIEEDKREDRMECHCGFLRRRAVTWLHFVGGYRPAVTSFPLATFSLVVILISTVVIVSALSLSCFYGSSPARLDAGRQIYSDSFVDVSVVLPSILRYSCIKEWKPQALTGLGGT
jgi:hypothetical protein